jgi:L-fuconolactonase
MICLLSEGFFARRTSIHFSKQQCGGCVRVQVNQTEKENKFFLDFAEEFDFIKGIVGWVYLMAENIEERLATGMNIKR